MSDETRAKKDETLRLLSKAEIQAARLQDLGQDIVQSARLSSDVLKPIRELVSQGGADSLLPEQWDHILNTVRSWQAVADKLEESRTLVNTFGAQALSVASTSNTTALFVTSGTLTVPGGQGPIWQLGQVLNRTPLIDNARASLRRLKLDKRGGNVRSALELLEDAKAGLDRPSSPEGSPLSVLLALRECLNLVVSELLRRRPKQEPAAKTSQKLSGVVPDAVELG